MKRSFPYVPWLDKSNVRFVKARYKDFGVNLTDEEAQILIKDFMSPFEQIAYRKRIDHYFSSVDSSSDLS